MAVTYDKFLPELFATSSLTDLDLFYITGSSSGDYQTTAQMMRKLMNPVFSSTFKTSNYSIQLSECDGRWFSNKDATGEVILTLPSISDGLIVGFLVESAFNLKIKPQISDSIVQITTVVGNSLIDSTIGDSIVLRSTDYGWYVIRKAGTWSEIA